MNTEPSFFDDKVYEGSHCLLARRFYGCVRRVLGKARADVRNALLVWTDILEATLGNRIDYVYAKGSAIKPWDSPIDYVPYISDLDVHIMLKEGESLLS